MVGDQLQKGALEVSVLHSADKWFGMTYHEDREIVAEELRKLHARGDYPESLRGAGDESEHAGGFAPSAGGRWTSGRRAGAWL